VRVVLDTSVLIAGLRSSAGTSAECIRLALVCEIRLLMDYKLSCEYRDVAFRPHHLLESGKTRDDVTLVLDTLEEVAEPVSVHFVYRPLSPDQSDNLVLDVAINGNADCIVTVNLKHFVEPAGQFGLRVVTPREFLILMRERSS